MLQQYQQPTFDFSQVASPSIPQPSVAPATPPQAYTPFVSTMPLYDPSTLGTGLPSTAGMADPFFVYDPYSPVGAFDAPPARTGPTPPDRGGRRDERMMAQMPPVLPMPTIRPTVMPRDPNQIKKAVTPVGTAVTDQAMNEYLRLAGLA